MTGFIGSFRHQIDNKGRLNLPAKFRRPVGTMETYVITPGLNGCLNVFPEEEWNKAQEKLKALGRNNPDNVYYLRATLSRSFVVQADTQGRITLSAPLIKEAKLDKEVLVVGMLDRMEIWNPDIFADYLSKCEESYEEVARKIEI